MTRKTLSKSKLMAYRQCPRRLWLEVRRPDLREDFASAQARFDAGHEVGNIPRRTHDPQGCGALLDPNSFGVDGAIRQIRSLLARWPPIVDTGRVDFVGAKPFLRAELLIPGLRVCDGCFEPDSGGSTTIGENKLCRSNLKLKR